MLQEVKKWKIWIYFTEKSNSNFDGKRYDPKLIVFEIYDDHYYNMLNKLKEIHFPFGMEVEKVVIEG